MNISLILIIVLVPLLYLVLPFLILVFTKNIKIRNILISILLTMFCIVLLIGVISNFYYTDNSVCVCLDFTNSSTKTIDLNFLNNNIIDTLINLVMLIPIGMSIVVLNSHNKKLKIILLFTIGFVVGFSIELLQFALPIYRAVQIIDIVNNGLSVILGGAIGELYLLIAKRIRNK